MVRRRTRLSAARDGLAQVVTDGMRIVLEAGGSRYDYRAGGVGDPCLCVQAVTSDKGSPEINEITEDGSAVIVVPPSGEGDGLPAEGNNAPDK